MTAKAALPAAAAGLLLACHAALLLGAARRLAPTFDEPAHIAAGYAYWTRADFDLETEHPPLAKLIAALPLLALRPALPFAKAERPSDAMQAGPEFLYAPGNEPDRILFLARLPGIALSVVLGGVLFAWARRRWGSASGLLALAVYAFEPNILAHAGLATMDFPLAFFSALWTLAWLDEDRRPLSHSGTARCAALGAACLLTKYSAVYLAAASLAWTLLFRRGRLGRWAACWALSAAAAAAVLAAWGRLGDVPARLLEPRAGFRHSFLLGRYSTTGWWWYFAAAFALKTPLAELALAAAGTWKAARERSAEAGLLVLGPAVLFAAASAARMQLGLRYLLPAYPMLALLAGRSLKERSGRRAALAAALVLGPALSCLGASPEFLAYFNEAAGGSSRGWRLLVDSNLDWGQDLKGLAVFLKDRPGAVLLSYFGTARPEAYGIEAQDVLSVPSLRVQRVNAAPAGREYLVVSATNLQGVYYRDHAAFAWLRDRTPDFRVGASLFVYDVTDDAVSHRELARLYREAGDAARAEREARRAQKG